MNRLLAAISGASLVLVALVGCVDAARNDETGLAILFGLLVLGVAGITAAQFRSHTVVLRRDLATWVARTSAATGETPDEMTSRAVSRLRSGFGAVDDATK